jgi:CPA1 family monovalent cation:H+ antiporter
MPNIADSLGLLIGVVVIATIADRVRIPYPILMVVVGVGVALVPTHHRVALPPNLILLVFLPPLIYDASLETSLEEIRAQLRPILLLAVGLVVATMTVVAVVIHQLVPGTSWAVAFTLGAVVSPPDSIAATQIAGKLGLPRSLTTILGGEGLMNDATALTAYQLAVAAVATGFTVADVIGRFAFAVVAGVAIGLGVGWAISRLLRLIETPVIENTLLLVLPFAAYLPADELKASGVLAVVAAGLFFGRYGSTSLSPAARLQQHQIWDLIVFLLTGLSFLLVGLELREVLDSLTNRESGSLVLESLAVVGAVIGVRLVWIFGASVLPRRFRLLGPGPPGTTWRQSAVVGWAGMRGAVSLAAALALPTTFPGRDLVVFLTFAVIVATLVGQGLTLPPLIRRLGVVSSGDQDTVAELRTRRRLTLTAIRRIEELATSDGFPSDVVERLRLGYEFQLARIERRLGSFDEGADGDRVGGGGEGPEAGADGGRVADRPPSPAEAEAQLRSEMDLRHLVIEAERDELDGLVARGRISQRVASSVRVALDLDETTMRPGTT